MMPAFFFNSVIFTLIFLTTESLFFLFMYTEMLLFQTEKVFKKWKFSSVFKKKKTTFGGEDLSIFLLIFLQIY